jgi:hypothetical protein
VWGRHYARDSWNKEKLRIEPYEITI